MMQPSCTYFQSFNICKWMNTKVYLFPLGWLHPEVKLSYSWYNEGQFPLHHTYNLHITTISTLKLMHLVLQCIRYFSHPVLVTFSSALEIQSAPVNITIESSFPAGQLSESLLDLSHLVSWKLEIFWVSIW